MNVAGRGAQNLEAQRGPAGPTGEPWIDASSQLGGRLTPSNLSPINPSQLSDFLSSTYADSGAMSWGAM